jgi:predicted lipoprotein with Yx(FWY)xxD motif
METGMKTSTRVRLYVAGGAAAAALAATLAVTLTSDSSPGYPATPAGAAGAVVAVHPTALGRILVDGQGRTLYLFAKDTGSTSTCVGGGCTSVWPPAAVDGSPQATAGALAADLATITRPDGGTQLSYHGHPLYYYVGDRRAGDVAGQNLDQFGGRWYALDSAGNAVTSAPVAGDTGGGPVY